jgi:cytochrome c2
MKLNSFAYKNIFVFISLFLTICLITPGCKNDKPQEAIATVQDKEYLLGLDSLLKPYDLVEFTIPNDVVYGKNKVYRGVRSDTVFKGLIRKYGLDTFKYMVVFHCSDGYKPHMNLSDLLSDKGYFALKDVSPKNDSLKKPGKEFNPVYLVWDIPAPDEVHQFPYGVSEISIELKSNQNKMEKLVAGEPKVKEGYHKFRDNCQKCHSINDEGGNVGPDLSYPMNVTEYWDKNALLLFIKNPQQFRHNSKMPVPENVSDTDISNIVGYLSFMKMHKKTN